MTIIEENWDANVPAQESEGSTVIYVLIDPRDNQARYVGKTTKPRIRLTAHMRDLIPSWKRNWIRSLRSLALEPIIEILEDLGKNPEATEWKEAEMFWISYLRFIGANLTNLTDGGEGLHGHVFTAEHRRKIGDAHLGRIVSKETLARMSEAGKRQSHEHLRNLAKAQRGTKSSPERCAKLSASHAGKTHSLETKARMSISALGRRATDETKKRMSEAQKNRSEEHQEKLSASKRGVAFSPERRAKMALAQLGKKHSPETRAKISKALKSYYSEPRPCGIAT